MDLVPALAVMLGANVGTTLIVQVLSFDVAEIAPALILIGVLMFRRAPAAPRDFGHVLIGLGLCRCSCLSCAGEQRRAAEEPTSSGR